jgi:MoaA/NifB/PqqE/SkfB family radical SAM enzyme
MAPRFNLDIEPTNRCNAKCNFCPRDQTPHQGLMTPEVFAQALERAVEFREVLLAGWGTTMKVNLCGLGEPLLNRHTVDFVRAVREADFEISISTNASLLDEAHATALLEAGLQGAAINVGDLDEEYDEVYRLPFEKTLDNVVRFKKMIGPDFELHLVVVDHRGDPEHLQRMYEFWRQHEINQFITYPIMNRGGALSVDHMQYESYPERVQARELLHRDGEATMCSVPFQLPFIGYDGQYYLCCSDWKKEAPLGSVFDFGFVELTRDRLRHVIGREPVCKTCNLDPVNVVTDKLRAQAAGEISPADVDATVRALLGSMAETRDVLAVLDPGAIDAVGVPDPPTRTLIPVRSV